MAFVKQGFYIVQKIYTIQTHNFADYNVDKVILVVMVKILK